MPDPERHLRCSKIKPILSICDVSKLSRADEDLYDAVNDNDCWRKLFRRDHSRAYQYIEGVGKWFKNSDWKFSYVYHMRMVCFGYTKILPREIRYSRINPSCTECVSKRSEECCLFFDPLYFQKTRISLRVGQVIIAFVNIYGIKTPKLGKITKILPRAYSDEPFAELSELKIENCNILETGDSFTVPSKDPEYGTYIDNLVITNILLHSECSHNF